jgi:2-polyprenyl-3-methyl-5-hydroxy-6-metoxy-1,4-benzoquinol methylase
VGRILNRTVSLGWKDSLLDTRGDGLLPDDYLRVGQIVGRREFLAATDLPWSESEFVARAETPYTTSAVEAEIRRRLLERIAMRNQLERDKLTLELGCADGLVTRHLRELGFSKLVATDVVHSSVAKLESSLEPSAHQHVMLMVDDLLRIPFAGSPFHTVIAWGVLSVTEDFDQALQAAWGWVRPGGHLLVAEPLLEAALVYALVRSDLSEFGRVYREQTRPAMWDRRNDRYSVNPHRFYQVRLSKLPAASIVDTGGVSLLPSLTLGGLLQDSPVADAEKASLAELLSSSELDELALWRQAYWLVRKG